MKEFSKARSLKSMAVAELRGSAVRGLTACRVPKRPRQRFPSRFQVNISPAGRAALPLASAEREHGYTRRYMGGANQQALEKHSSCESS